MSIIPVSIPYLPLLELKPAEMLALQELPEKVKDLLFPAFSLKSWVGSHRLEKSIERLKRAYGDRPAILELSAFENAQNRRGVHDEMDRLRNPDNGYGAWVDYLKSELLENFVPAAQLGSQGELAPQLASLFELGRGVCVRISRELFPAASLIVRAAQRVSHSGAGFIVVFDFGTIRHGALAQDAEWLALAIGQIRSELPELRIAVSGTSFPNSFVGLSSQRIHERDLHAAIIEKTKLAVIYSDHGSARVENNVGGGGAPPPRIDYPTARDWYFFRDDTKGERLTGYVEQARACVSSAAWDPNLMVWGRQMIERTALGDDSAVVSQARAAAARINIHLHRQLFFQDPSGLYDTDESWSD